MKKLLLILSALVLFATGCGAIDEKQAERILSGAAQTAVAGVTFVPETPGATQDVNVIVQQTFAAMTAQASGGQPLVTPPAPNATTGSISGQLNYPADALPAMYVTAYLVGTQTYQYVITNPGQGTYKIDNLPPGVYHVIAYTVGSDSFPAGFAGGYTQVVPCGFNANCNDHTLIDVTVTAGHDSGGVNPGDWYAPEGTFPPFPQAAQPTDSGPQPLTGNGGISGTLTYPAEKLPAMAVVAFHVGGGHNDYYYVLTDEGQSTYTISAPPGQYYIVAYTLGGGGFPAGLAGGYTKAVPCGLTAACTDHSLIPVQISPMVVLVSDANPGDWYAPSGTFPPYPLP